MRAPATVLQLGPFDNSYARLPERFHAAQLPARVAAPSLVAVNRPLAELLGLSLEGLDDDTLARLFSGQLIPAGAQPLALAYAGHQFGHFVPQLGDGRALLLGETVGRDGRRRDIQFKGSGRTPFSRRGDGRAALGPVLREYLLGEAMHALGIPTTRALAAVRTGETVLRELPQSGAVLTRVAASHVRVGTFEYFAARDDHEALQLLCDHVIARHWPRAGQAAVPALGLLEAVVDAQAALVARWMLVGFIHGVMNTDNMTISGETIDYGPCAFMEAYDPATVFSAIDSHGRYAYANQPAVAHWNLAQLARALLPLLAPQREAALELARAALERFPARFAGAWLDGMCAKLGLQSRQEDDERLVDDWLDLLHSGQADFTLAFRRLADCADAAGLSGGVAGTGATAHSQPVGRHAADGNPGRADEALAALFADPSAPAGWLARWRVRLARDPARSPAQRAAAMRGVNPAIIARNHQVEQALAAAEQGDDQPFARLLAALAHPWQPRDEDLPYMAPATPAERVTRTFCGT